MTLTLLSGLAPLADRYDALILDLWGVVHDGRRPYAGALECLSRLGGAGKRRLFLSNAPRRSGPIVSFLADMGIEKGRHFDDLISSGDLAREALARRDDPWHQALGRRYLHIGPQRDTALLEGLDYRAVAEGEADFILNTGLFDDEREGVADYAPLLERAVGAARPMVCVNPDLTVMRGEREVLCAGALAQAYAERAGDVRYHGKPHRPAYEACFDRLRGMDRGRILAVGDSLRTDIAGAAAAGLDTVLVTGGIHADEFDGGSGGAAATERIERACAREGVRPDAVLPRLVW